jgi:hypothetical protein
MGKLHLALLVSYPESQCSHHLGIIFISDGIGCNTKDPADVVNFGKLVKVRGLHLIQLLQSS